MVTTARGSEACCLLRAVLGVCLMDGLPLQVKTKAESLGVLSSSSHQEEEGDGHSEGRKLKAPDADTMVVKVPSKEHSGSIGPIWNDDPSTSKESQVQQS